MKFLSSFLIEHQLNRQFESTAQEYFVPLCKWAASHKKNKTPIVLGINGAQGTGKSTLSDFVAQYMKETYQWKCCTLSIDDLYLTLNEREKLSQDIHPLLLTRGVPGTHDTSLGIQLIQRLKTLNKKDSLPIPRFDKLSDDRRSETEWDVVNGPIDLILFEGWCVGSSAQESEALTTPINKLESEKDSNGQWRQYVNQQLAGEYQQLFSLIDHLIFIEAPSLEAVKQWRFEQECKLLNKTNLKPKSPMGQSEINNFIQFFERITLHNIQTLNLRCDVHIKLLHDHSIADVNYKTK